MKLRWLAIPGLLLLGLGLVFGLLPHEATYVNEFGPRTVSCGMAFAGDTEAKVAETSAALAGTFRDGPRYEPGKILAACSSAQMLWLVIVLLVLGGLLVVVAAVMAVVRNNAAARQSPTWG